MMKKNLLVFMFFMVSGVATPFAAEITGIVTDSASGSPLDSVSVFLGDGVAASTLTDDLGFFSITTADGVASRPSAVAAALPLSFHAGSGVISWKGYEGAMNIAVVDLRGAVKARFSSRKPTASHFTLPPLPAGLYLVRADTDQGRVIFKMVNFGRTSASRFQERATLHRKQSTDRIGLAKTASTTLKFAKSGYATTYRSFIGSQSGLKIKMQKATLVSYSPGVSALPDEVKNNNTRLMLGKRRGVAMMIKWPVEGCDYTPEEIEKTNANIAKKWNTWSRGRVQHVGMDGTGTQYNVMPPDSCEVPYEKKSSNETKAHEYLRKKFNLPSTTFSWFVNSGNSHPNAGGSSFDSHGPNPFTATHELGHLFRMGHGYLVKYNEDSTFESIDRYGDLTTYMGRRSAGGFNLPEYHRLKWIDEDEVAVFKKEKSGTVYRIRNIQNRVDTGYYAGVAYYLPVTGNCMWISVNDRKVYGDSLLGNQLALTKYVTGWHRTSVMQSTYCITHMIGAHTDDFGLTYEVVAIDKSSKRAWADIRITYDPSNETRTKPLIMKPSLKLLTPVTSGKRGKMQVTIEVTNPNSPTSTPCIEQNDGLTVPNAARVRETKDSKTVERAIPGGSSFTVVYEVESKPGPLTPENARLRGSYRLAHIDPFEFSIDFEW